MDILFHYNFDENTGEITFIGKEEITVDTATSTKRQAKAVKVEANIEPLITLDSNKLVLTTGAVQFMNICADCRIDIKYEKKDKKAVPIIGTDAAFGTKAGNKLTKSNTVSYRGAANEKLAAYGTTFRLEPTKNTGIYYLVGDMEPAEEKVPEEIINIENELDIDVLDDLNVDSDSTELEGFDFKL